MKRLSLLVLFSVGAWLASVALTVDDVRVMIENGDYKAAMQALEPMRKKSPRDTNLSLLYGNAAVALGLYDEAVEGYSAAADRGNLEAYPPLVEIEIDHYDIDAASDHLAAWKEALRKAKKPQPESLERYESRITLVSNYLDRVESIPVIARVDIPRETFDKTLNRLSAPDARPGMAFLPDGTPFFVNNMSRDVFWTEPDAEGVNRLFTAGILDDGTREQPVELTQYVGDGDIAAPFLLEDGETLYFAAARDDDGVGGYDIYMTRRDGDGGFYEPSNIGMPYNSPGDELLFVIDEPNGIGWWVTDRYDSPDTVSILYFIPNSVRRNISPDDEDIKELAFVSDIELTQPSGFDIKAARRHIPRPEDNADTSDVAPEFVLSLGNGRVVTAMSQFKNRQAASTMSEVLRAERILQDTVSRLRVLRAAYADGDKSLRQDIRDLENEVERKQTEIRNMRNNVIRLETSGR